VQALLTASSTKSKIGDAYSDDLDKEWRPLSEKYNQHFAPLEKAIEQIEHAQRAARGIAAVHAFCCPGNNNGMNASENHLEHGDTSTPVCRRLSHGSSCIVLHKSSVPVKLRSIV
jgi:hypothetical protein